MTLDQATLALQDTAALWSIDAVSPQAVVGCACDALIAGLDSPSLRILAGLTRAEAGYHVLDILPAALAELGLDFYPRDSRGGQEAAAYALAAQAVSGSLTPRELAAAIGRHFGHNLLPLTERLAVLDEVYDLGFDPGTYAPMTREQIDQDVLAEARKLTHEQAGQRTAHHDQ